MTCAWAGLYRVRAVTTTPYANWPSAAANPCPACGDGEVRAAANPDEERQAVRAHLAIRLPDVQLAMTSEGKTVATLRSGRRAPVVIAVDLDAVRLDPRATIDDLGVRLQTGAAAGSAPYR